jgi:hypothetical protein
MKNLFLFLTLFLIASAGFAQRVLTSEEKESLREDPVFVGYCQWATRDYAAYWASHDGAGLSSEAQRIKWAKDRYLSVPIVGGDIHDPNIALQFLKVGKGIQYDIGTAPQSNSVIIAAMLAGNKFEEMASLYFDLLGEGVNFSIGGN